MYKRLPILFVLLGLTGIPAMAQSTDTISSTSAFYIVAGFVIVVALLVLFTAIAVLQVLRAVVKRRDAELGIVHEPKKSWWSKFLTSANDAVPIEKETEILLDHNYDGIRELDNHLPPWWKWLFYVTIIFGVVYLLAYHVFQSMPLQTEEYQIAMNEAEDQRLARLADQPLKDIDVSNVELVDDPVALAEGGQIYTINCVQCHKDDGGGGIGPNLTDEYWLHGGSIENVFTTIKEGVPEKGMISWAPLLSPEQMQNVASYVLTQFPGTTPANPKEPQGELYVPETMEPDEIDRELVPADSAYVQSDSTSIAALN